MVYVKTRGRLDIWKDVVFAIFLREIRSKFNDKLGLAWSVIQPVIFISLLSFLRGALDGGDTHSMPTYFFIVYGMSIVLFFNVTFSNCSNAIQKNRSLFSFRQVQPISSVIAIALLELLIQIFIYVVVFSLAFIFKIDIYIYDVTWVITSVFSIWWLALNMGLILSLLSSFVPEIKKMRVVLMRPVIFVSGVFFSLQDIPREYWKYFDWNPILHAIELARQGAYPSFGAIGVSYSYVFIILLVLTFLTLILYKFLWKSAISR